MGALHVVTGADHISAVASLACGNSRWRAFWLGVRWGAGHSVGLVFVFVAVLALEKETDAGFMRGMNRWMGAVVGLLMIALGLYGARRARNKSDDGGDDDDARDAAPDDEEEEATAPLVGARPPRSSSSRRMAPYGVADAQERGEADANSRAERPGTASTDPRVVGPGPGPAPSGPAMPAPPHANAPVAVAVGVVHGAAGPGAVLGVLPAVALRAPRLVVGYFAGFIAATVLTMGAFAMLWGEVTGIAGKRGAGDGANLGVRQLGGVRDRRRRVRRAHPSRVRTGLGETRMGVEGGSFGTYTVGGLIRGGGKVMWSSRVGGGSGAPEG